jgi:nitrile hydratase accessory protein
MSDPADTATEADNSTFAEPWQARAFALAVAATDEDGDRPWETFQEALVERVPDAEEPDPDVPASLDGEDDEYYRDWLAALEGTLTDGAVDAEVLRERALAFERGDRDAHEFVDGDPHEHADSLPAGHAVGSDHDHGGGHDGHAH